MNRRQLLRQAAALPAILASSVGAQGDFWRQPRSIWLQRMTHSGLEEVKAVYFADGRVVADGYLAACRLLRGVRAGQGGRWWGVGGWGVGGWWGGGGEARRCRCRWCCWTYCAASRASCGPTAIRFHADHFRPSPPGNQSNQPGRRAPPPAYP